MRSTAYLVSVLHNVRYFFIAQCHGEYIMCNTQYISCFIIYRLLWHWLVWGGSFGYLMLPWWSIIRGCNYARVWQHTHNITDILLRDALLWVVFIRFHLLLFFDVINYLVPSYRIMCMTLSCWPSQGQCIPLQTQPIYLYLLYSYMIVNIIYNKNIA